MDAVQQRARIGADAVHAATLRYLDTDANGWQCFIFAEATTTSPPSSATSQYPLPLAVTRTLIAEFAAGDAASCQCPCSADQTFPGGATAG